MTDVLVHDPAVCLTGRRKPSRGPQHLAADWVDVERFLFNKKQQATLGAPWSLVDGTDIEFQMYLNDKYGCCTLAGAGNLMIAQSHGSEVVSDDAIETGYEAVTLAEGAEFNPGPPPVNDNGCEEPDVLDYWQTVGIGGVKILGHAGVNMQDEGEWSACFPIFGGGYLGIELAVEQQSQNIWDYVQGSSPGSWGGHCVPEVGFNIGPSGLVEVVTWGAVKQATLAFIGNQADEGHVVITPQWIAANENNPLINMAKLQADLGIGGLTPEG